MSHLLGARLGARKPSQPCLERGSGAVSAAPECRVNASGNNLPIGKLSCRRPPRCPGTQVLAITRLAAFRATRYEIQIGVWRSTHDALSFDHACRRYLVQFGFDARSRPHAELLPKQSGRDSVFSSPIGISCTMSPSIVI